MSIRRRTPEPENTGKYNVKTAARLVGLLPVTLRAWERRYGLPAPARGAQGYRLYSDYDLQLLRWLKSQTDAGVSISRAAQSWAELCASGSDPLAESGRAARASIALDDLAAEALASLRGLNEDGAARALRLAWSLYPLDQVLHGFLRPVLVTLGDGWHRGDTPMAVERFATQFCLRHLLGLLGPNVAPIRPEIIVAAGAPGERHEIGLLMIVALLRARGWDARYLGPDVSLDRLAEALAPLRPRLLLFSARRPESAQALAGLPDMLARLPPPAPRVVCGGPGFAECGPASGEYLHGELLDMVRAIEAQI